MNKPISSTSCQSGCWILAAASGLVVLAVCLFLIDMGILASIFMGAVVFIVVGLLLGWIFCSESKPLVQPNDTSAAPSAPEPAPVSLGGIGTVVRNTLPLTVVALELHPELGGPAAVGLARLRVDREANHLL